MNDNQKIQDKTILSLDPYIVYDYSSLLTNSYCPTCNCIIQWVLPNEILPGTKDVLFRVASDKFCIGECCGIVYSMVPETVRILSQPYASFKSNTKRPEVNDDEDFLKALENLK